MWQIILERLGTIFSQILAGLLFLASIAGALNFIRSLFLDKRKLRILIGFEQETGLGSSLTFTVINSGRRVVVLERAVLVCLGDEIKIRGRHDFPIRLNETDKSVFYFHINHPNYAKSFTPSTELKFFEATDTFGKRWRFPGIWPSEQLAWKRETRLVAEAIRKRKPE